MIFKTLWANSHNANDNIIVPFDTGSFLEEKDESLLEQLYINMCAVRNVYPISNPPVVSPIKLTFPRKRIVSFSEGKVCLVL